MQDLNFIYKLIPSSNPPSDPLPKSLPLSDFDRNSGFIHLSTASQVPGTLKLFFGDHSRVYVARVDYKAVRKDIKWEDPKGEVCSVNREEGLFPHLYNGGHLGRDEIESVAVWERTNSDWDSVIKKAEGWLID